MAVSVALVAVGLAGLSIVSACIWLPLGLLPLSVGAVLAGLFVDWEGADGNSAAPHRRQTR